MFHTFERKQKAKPKLQSMSGVALSMTSPIARFPLNGSSVNNDKTLIGSFPIALTTKEAIKKVKTIEMTGDR